MFGLKNIVTTVTGGPQTAVHPVGRNALLIRSVKSAFALLLKKVTKPGGAITIVARILTVLLKRFYLVSFAVAKPIYMISCYNKTPAGAG